MIISAEYIWVDGSKPNYALRCKTRILETDQISFDPNDYPVWSYDGSSTFQAEGSSSDLSLKPVCVVQDPVCANQGVLVLCEVLLPNNTAHATNYRQQCEAVLQTESNDQIQSLTQNYTMNACPSIIRNIIEQYVAACVKAKLRINGITDLSYLIDTSNPVNGFDILELCDHLILARWLLARIAEDYNVQVELGDVLLNGKAHDSTNIYNILASAHHAQLTYDIVDRVSIA